MTVTAGAGAPLTDRGRRTRGHLVAAARRVFEERGWAATRMSDIAEAAGTSHGTVYTYFDSKDAVLAAVVEDTFAMVYDALRVPDIDDPVARIEAANRRYVDAYRANARLLAVVEHVADGDAGLRDALADVRRTHVRRVARTVARLKDDGVAAPDLDAHVTAAALCSMVEGFCRHWLGRGEPHDEDVAVATLTTLWARALGLTASVPTTPRRGTGSPPASTTGSSPPAVARSRPTASVPEADPERAPTPSPAFPSTTVRRPSRRTP